MSGASQLILPITLWGRYAPSHCISSLLLTKDQKSIITGCNDGQICVWDLQDSLKTIPRCLLFGHSASVQCLANGSQLPDVSLLVSSSESGEMCLWDLSDGRCLEVTKLPFVHSNIQSYQISTGELQLFCNGYYAEILVMDPMTLEVLYTLSSRVCPDWINSLHVLRPSKKQDDIVLALSASGLIKMWSLISIDHKPYETIYENESKPIRCINALQLTCCPSNQRTLLIVCGKYWQIIDAGDFSILCSTDNKLGERWTGGNFVSADKVVVWSDAGKGYLYKLPANKLRGKAISSIADNEFFHSQNTENPFLYLILEVPFDERLLCPPAMDSFEITNSSNAHKVLIRGDSGGRLTLWTIPENVNISNSTPSVIHPKSSQSLQESWDSMNPCPPGILDKVGSNDNLKLTASVYLPLQGRFVCGREDGSIIIISISQTVMLQLLFGKHQSYESWPAHQLLYGHTGRVTCLLYPRQVHERYDLAHLVSGGVDFSVCLWDLYAGTLLHRFCVHAGEITQLLVPPDTCNQRVLTCICSVASDHSVSLLSLKERKCILLASRHIFPVQLIKWRPLEDFMVVECSDGSVYVWQTETGHLDRVAQGLLAEDILNACNAHTSTPGESLLNPRIHLLRGLRHGNLAAIRHAAQRGLHQLQQGSHLPNQAGEQGSQRSRAHPLVVQGLRTNPKDTESHVLFFDIEALVVQLLSDEYANLSPGQLETQGLTSHAEYKKYISMSSSPESQHKLTGFLAKVKDTAEIAANKLQAKAESVGFKSMTGEVNIGRKGSNTSDTSNQKPKPLVTNLTMEIAQLLLSTLHSWGLDSELDRKCESQLGLLRPMRPICYGLLSRAGHMALLLPTFIQTMDLVDSTENPKGGLVDSIPKEIVQEGERAAKFCSQGHWSLSTSLTTNHLLTIIALANTLMSMSNATFVSEQDKRRKLMRTPSRAENKMMDLQHEQSQIKEGWSMLAALHCILHPELVKDFTYKRPQVELLARRWQDRCLEVREASQALLLAELRRMGESGRKKVVEEWGPYLPNYDSQPAPSMAVLTATIISPTSDSHSSNHAGSSDEEDNFECQKLKISSSVSEINRKQATAIILLGVIGSEYGHEIEESRRRSGDEDKKKKIVEGFSLSDNSLARCTSKALAYQLLSNRYQNTHTPLRRAAIDLIGRGFTVWEAHLDATKILLGLLELCCITDSPVPSMSYGLPLSPEADSSRTARHALSLIATARPPIFITKLNQEVMRYHTMVQNPQIHSNVPQSNLLIRARPEILRIIEVLIEKMQSDVVDLLVEVMDIILHCLDSNQLKTRGLNEVFPAICRFHNVTYCPSTRRIAVGAKNGQLALYEIKASKCQMIPAHDAPITATRFSQDGKYLASFSCNENKLCFWQTASGLFGLGNSQTRCVRTYSTQNLSNKPNVKADSLVWINNKSVVLMLTDGTQKQFNVT